MNKSILLMAVIAICFSACKKDPLASFPPELTASKSGLIASFDSLNKDMSAAAYFLGQNINDSIVIRAKMMDLFSRTSFVLEFSFVTPQGIMKIIEPGIYHATQGTDISQQSHIVKAFQTKEPVLSETFLAVEGFYAAVDIHPIIHNGQLLGGVASLFYPQAILGNIMNPLLKNQTFELWAMEKGGKMIFNQDLGEIGRNIFTDDLYKPFPELIAAANKIASEEYGETTYSFYQTGTNDVVVKRTYWVTYSLYGTEWKLVWVKPE